MILDTGSARLIHTINKDDTYTMTQYKNDVKLFVSSCKL